MIGNKSDLTDLRRVDPNVAREFAEQYNMPFYEVSSKNDDDKQNIESIFMTIAEKLQKERSDDKKRAKVLDKTGSLQSRTADNNVTLKNEKTEKLEKEKKKCCSSGS